MALRRHWVKPGAHYGSLQVIKEVLRKNNVGHAERYVKCRCKCGRAKVTKLILLVSGQTTTCGAGIHRIDWHKPFKAFQAGRKYGNLRPLKEIPRLDKKKHRMFLCLCDCGKKTVRNFYSVLYGLTRSCGCLKVLDEAEREVRKFALKLKCLLRYSLAYIGSHKRSRRTFEMLGYSREDAYKHFCKFIGKRCQDRRACRGKVLTRKNSHIDHIIPVSKAKTESDVIELSQLSNLRLICGRCNVRKHTSL